MTLRELYRKLYDTKDQFNKEEDVTEKTRLANKILDLDKQILELEELKD